jgi:predicted dehydrogenase
MPVLNVGVIGCADIAQRKTIPAILGEPAMRLVAVASRSPERAAEFASRFGCAPVTGYQALLERSDLDAVYIPLPPSLHAEWIGRALAAGKHVLAEKPLATSPAEAAELVAAARAGGRLLMENFAFLHHSQQASVQRLVAMGSIGELRSLSAEFGFPPLPADNIRYQRHLGGGALLDAGVYTLRAASLFLGPRLGVAGAALRVAIGSQVDVAGAALVITPEGRTGQLTFGFDRAYRSGYTLWGSEGRIAVDRAFSAPCGYRPVLRLERQDLVEERTLAADDQFANMIAAFATAALSGKAADPAMLEIVRQAELVDAVRGAATPQS